MLAVLLQRRGADLAPELLCMAARKLLGLLQVSGSAISWSTGSDPPAITPLPHPSFWQNKCS